MIKLDFMDQFQRTSCSKVNDNDYTYMFRGFYTIFSPPGDKLDFMKAILSTSKYILQIMCAIFFSLKVPKRKSFWTTTRYRKYNFDILVL